MRTKSITLIYKVTQAEIFPPSELDLKRKDEWLKQLKGEVEADYKPLIVKVRYELMNPEIERISKFFNGPVILYYAIQNQGMTEGEPDSNMLKQYREEILDELLGYDYKTVNKTVHTRTSTSTYKSVQAWNNLAKLCEETLFDSAGYEFPDSELFWELAKKHSYDEARKIVVKQLQERMKKRI